MATISNASKKLTMQKLASDVRFLLSDFAADAICRHLFFKANQRFDVIALAAVLMDFVS